MAFVDSVCIQMDLGNSIFDFIFMAQLSPYVKRHLVMYSQVLPWQRQREFSIKMGIYFEYCHRIKSYSTAELNSFTAASLPSTISLILAIHRLPKVNML